MRSPLRRGMRAFLHAATLSLVWSQTANSNCPCLNSGADFGVTGALTPGIGGKRYNYGSSYGFASCAAHDSGKAPFCTGTSEDPMFCSESWCYVDPELCSTGLPPAQSAYFKDLFYSYSTCGSENTFQSWFTTSGSGYSQNHALTELATVVTNYVKNVVQVLEDNEAELRDVSTNCDYDAACPSGGCCACAAQSAWGSAPPLTFQQTLSLPLGNGVMPGSDACLSSVVSGTFQRVGSSEGSASRIGYQYYGSDEGTYMGWPGVEDCSTTYDPRFRDWYAGAAAGPKDVIIVIDTSGSMSYSGRMTLARDAAKKVLGTLTSVDYATVVGFSSSTTKYSSVLVQMSESNKNLLRTWMDTNLQANGGTNFVAAFAAVAQVISASTSATTNCNRVVLFLSDGEPNSWSSSDYSTATSQLSGYQLITYALGSGADSTILKQLACENEGILYEVADNANLGDVMAGYYKLLSPELDPCQPRWIEYPDLYTGTNLLAMCMAAYRKYASGDANSCNGGTTAYGTGSSASTDWWKVPKLIGVACIDMSLVASDDDLRAQSGWPAFESRIRTEQLSCPRRTLTEGQREVLRRDVSLGAMCNSAGPIPASVVGEPAYQASGNERQCAAGFGVSSSGDGDEAEGLPIRLIGGAAGAVVVFVLLTLAYKQLVKANKAVPPMRQEVNSAVPVAQAVPMAVAQAVAMPMGQGVVPQGLQQVHQVHQTCTTTTTTTSVEQVV